MKKEDMADDEILDATLNSLKKIKENIDKTYKIMNENPIANALIPFLVLSFEHQTKIIEQYIKQYEQLRG